MAHEPPQIQQFLKNWMAEFGRAIEMFTGEAPMLSYTLSESVSIPKSASAIWLKQAFTGESNFDVWVGALEATWMQLGKALGDGPPDSLKSTYLELINQAQQGAATVTSIGLPTPLQCEKPETVTVPRFEAASFFIFDLEIVGDENPPLVIAVQRSAVKPLTVAPPDDSDNDHSDENSSEVDAGEFRTSDLRRVADISLPVSVSVGSTKLELSKVLQARAGSVISLAKDSGELMELLVDGIIVARGELVVVKGNYGFRIKQIVSQHQRISLCNN